MKYSHIVLAIRCFAESRNPSGLPKQGQALLEMVVVVLEREFARTLIEDGESSVSDLVKIFDKGVMSAFRRIGRHWPGREELLTWFERRGRVLTHVRPFFGASCPEVAMAATIVATVYPDSERPRKVLERQARHATLAPFRAAAVEALAAGWPAEESVMRLLLERARVDPDWTIRLKALEHLIARFPQHQATVELLNHFFSEEGTPEFFEAETELLRRGDQRAVDAVCRKAVADGADDRWRREAYISTLAQVILNHSVVRQILRDRAVNDEFSIARRKAIEGLSSTGGNDDFLLFRSAALSD